MLSISDLTKYTSKKKECTDKIFNQVLLKCHNRIKHAASKSYSSCFYNVPVCILGLPVYNLNNCIKYIMDKLVRNEFDVELRVPTTLVISWEKHEENYIKPIKIKEYQAPPPPIIQPLKKEFNSHLYYNNVPKQEDYFENERIIQALPMPQLTYIEPKYPTTLAVSKRPSATRETNTPEFKRQQAQNKLIKLKEKRSIKENEREIREIEKRLEKKIEKEHREKEKECQRNKQKYNFNFI
jgi:hypothetical protein